MKKKRFTKDEITKDEVEKIHESINQMQEYNLDLEIDGLNIDLEN